MNVSNDMVLPPGHIGVAIAPIPSSVTSFGMDVDNLSSSSSESSLHTASPLVFHSPKVLCDLVVNVKGTPCRLVPMRPRCAQTLLLSCRSLIRSSIDASVSDRISSKGPEKNDPRCGTRSMSASSPRAASTASAYTLYNVLLMAFAVSSMVSPKSNATQAPYTTFVASTA